PRPPPADGRCGAGRSDRGTRGADGVPQVPAGLENAAHSSLDEGRRRLLLQLRGRDGFPSGAQSLLRPPRPERVPCSRGSPPARAWGVLQPLRGAEQPRRVVDRGGRQRGRGHATRREDRRGDGMDREALSYDVVVVGGGTAGLAAATGGGGGGGGGAPGGGDGV